MTQASALEGVAMLGEEGLEVGAADFFFAFDEGGDADGEGAGGGVPGAHGFEPEHDLALVVHGAAGDHAGAVGTFGELRVERVGVPEGEGFGGLDVVMAVVEEVGGGGAGAGVVGDNGGETGGGEDAGGEAEAGELVAEPFGGAMAVGRVGGLGADAGDAQEVEPAVAGGGKGGGDRVEDGVDRGGGCHGAMMAEAGRRG